MHLYILTRGIKHEVDQFITELQGKYCRFKYAFPDKPGVLTDAYVQVAVRPIQLWEIVFPEEEKDVMFRTILGPGKGTPNNPKHSKQVWAIRKALGVDPVPDFPVDGPTMPIRRQGMEIVGIGTKPDYWQTPEGKKSDKKQEGMYEGL